MNRSLVVLVQPPIEDFYLTKKRTLPYGLAAIAACVKEKGFQVEILDALATHKSKIMDYPEEFSYLKPFYGKKDISAFCLFHEYRHFGYSFEHIGKLIRDKEPFLVGIASMFTPYSDQALKTAEMIKKFFPACKIVLGGHHPTLFPEKVLENPWVDIVLQGEGETNMGELCEALKNGSDLRHIPGIAFREKEKYHIAPPSWIQDFSKIPLPDTDLVHPVFYRRKTKKSIVVVAGRGCPMRCSYCSLSAVSSYAPFRQRPVLSVVKELELQAAADDICFIDFEDENLCLNREWFIRLFSRIQQIFAGKKVEIRAMNGLYPPSIDEEIITLMKASGFRTLNLALGSTSKVQLKKFQRPDVLEAFENALLLAQKHHLTCVSYIIAAAPGQTAQSSLDDLLYLARKRTLAGLSIFYPAPGSQDYTRCKEKGILPEHFSLMRSTALPLDDTTTRLEAVTLLRLSRILNFMKHLKDTKGCLPDPEPNPETALNPSLDRQTMSIKLLQWFLNDGIIRGILPDGSIFHPVFDAGLTHRFIRRINKNGVTGTV